MQIEHTQRLDIELVRELSKPGTKHSGGTDGLLASIHKVALHAIALPPAPLTILRRTSPAHPNEQRVRER